MFISHHYKVIFVHMQRTAGNSLTSVFSEYDPELENSSLSDQTLRKGEVSPERIKHCSAQEILQAIDQTMFNQYAKVSVVRNPFDRMLSWYSMFKNDTIQMVSYEENPVLWSIGDKVRKAIAPYLDSFESFLCVPPENIFYKRLNTSQCQFLSDNDGKLLVNHILRFEHLSEDFDSFRTAVDFPGELPHTNQSIRDKGYREQYTEESRRLIEDRFADDLKQFGYEF